MSDNNVKESAPNNNDNHNSDAVTAPLVQLPEKQYVDLNLLHLQQYLLEQKSILPNANSYNPSYLVMQSKNLLSKYQKHWDGQFKLENGYIDSPFKQESDEHFQPIVRKKPKHAVTIAEVYSTASPNIIRNIFENVPSLIQSSPTAAHLVDENPDYRTQYQNNMKLQEEQRQQQEEQNQIDAGTYHGHQLKNDLILKEAEENLQKKLYQQHQHEQSTIDLHQQAIMEQFKDSVMRIVVSDIESQTT